MEKNDKLDQIFLMQGALDAYIAKTRNLNFTTEEWVQKKSLALINEVSELVNEVNYKWWKNAKTLDLPAIKEELVDILHFLVGMCVNVGMTSDEMFNIYYNKNKENFDRQNGLSEKKGYEL